MITCIAFLRGINVGRAKRIAMADLRGLFARLGYANVRTLLNSGNVLFDTAHPDRKRIAAAVDVALQSNHGFSASVVVVTVAELDAIVAANPLLETATDPSRHLVAFVSAPADLAKASELLSGSWAPEAIALGPEAAYLWCAKGIIESRVLHAFARLTGDAATTRNWATVLKVQALASSGADAT